MNADHPSELTTAAPEPVGLAGMINVLGGLMTMFVVLLKGNVAAAPNAALLLDSFDPANVSHQLLDALNIFTIWFMLVLAIGAVALAKLQS